MSEIEDVVEYHADGTRTVRIQPKREWVGLTDDEINSIEFPESGTATMRDFVRIIEANLKEKNT
jgi:hypothetical protein